MDNRQKRYTDDFKRAAVQSALELKIPISHVALHLGISATTLRKWIDSYERLRSPEQCAKDYEDLQNAQKRIAELEQQVRFLEKQLAEATRPPLPSELIQYDSGSY
ncbi:MAG: transposase [Corynebacterium sp.]|nr:transposase [Corynebacterium sp.]